MILKRFLVATLLIAACALPNWASAQNVLGLPTSQAAGAVVTTPEVRAELMAWAPDGVAPGKQVWLGLQLAHIPQWHTYWKNPGDSGLATLLEWALPAGITAGEIAWPTPKKIPIGTLANYGYENTVLLPVPLTVASDFAALQLSVKLKASWLVCKEACIPQEGEFALTIPAQGSTGSNAAAFDAAFKAGPGSLPPGASAVTVEGQRLKVSLAGLPAALHGQTLAFFPETPGITEPAAPLQQSWQGGLWQAQMPLSNQRTESPTMLPVVVAAAGNAYRIEAPVNGSWPAALPVGTPPAVAAGLNGNAAAGAASGLTPAAPLGLLVALVGALLGGLLLNLMPCVLPVLAIKVIGFVQMKDPATRVAGGLAYTAGVVLSFVALGALLLGFRAAGEQLGWGFQLQNPAVVAGLALLFTVVGLN
ncbi:MAG: protein-disulfide reductase, partial [Polaromonas sp.]|nr:protein-disulfide reductase [Polaromonas sp.]